MQAARGASLSSQAETDDGPDDGGPDRRPRRIAGYVWPFWTVALAAYALDQVTKIVAVEQLTDRFEDVRVVGDLLTLTLVYNPGAAFGLGPRATVALAGLAIVATVVVLVVGRRAETRMWGLSLGLLLAGVAGNLTDRLLREPGPFRGHVVDFLQLPNWPVFNVADICINVAVVLIVILTIRGIRLDGSRHGDDGAAERGGADER